MATSGYCCSRCWNILVRVAARGDRDEACGHSCARVEAEVLGARGRECRATQSAGHELLYIMKK